MSAGYQDFEVSAVTRVIEEANDLKRQPLFERQFVSDAPGYVSSASGQMLRAEPAIDNHGLADIMIVVGGQNAAGAAWVSRMRQMQRSRKPVLLLSEAATAYIRTSAKPTGRVTTHWMAADVLREAAYHPGLTDRLAETSDGVTTSPGGIVTLDLMIGYVTPYFSQKEVAELSSRLLMPAVRKPTAEQPRGVSGSTTAFDRRVNDIIQLMENSISEPMSMPEIADAVGLSPRQIERVFRDLFHQSPAKFYKSLRTKRAWALIEQSMMPLPDIAVATGFGSLNTMATAVRDVYGVSPAKARAGRGRGGK